MNSPGRMYQWSRSISRTFNVKRRAMQNKGYCLISLTELLMRSSSQLNQNCNVSSCQKRLFRLPPGSNLNKGPSWEKKHVTTRNSIESRTHLHKNISTSTSSHATAAYTTHGEGDVDMHSKEFQRSLETHARYQPCPVSIGTSRGSQIKWTERLINKSFSAFLQDESFSLISNFYFSPLLGVWT